MRKRFKVLKEAMRMEIREHKKTFVLYVILRVLVIIMMILQIFNRNFENVFLCILTLFLLIVPSFIQVEFKIELPTTLEMIILLFIFCAEILGEISSFYLRFPMWDTILHTMNGFLAAAIGFSLVELLNENDKIKFQLSPIFVCVVAFCFSMTIGVMWEMFEFSMDQFLGTDTQKDTIVHKITSVELDSTRSNIPITIDDIDDVMINGQSLGLGGYLDIGLYDTMEDLIVNLIGAVVFSIFGFFYIQTKGKSKFASRFIPRKKKKSEDFKRIIQKKEAAG